MKQIGCFHYHATKPIDARGRYGLDGMIVKTPVLLQAE